MISNGQSDTVVIALAVLGFLSTLVTTLVGAYIAVKTKEVKNEVRQTHNLVNGMTTELRSAQVGQARAEGLNEGQATERDRASGAPQDVNVTNVEPVPVIPVHAEGGPPYKDLT